MRKAYEKFFKMANIVSGLLGNGHKWLESTGYSRFCIWHSGHWVGRVGDRIARGQPSICYGLYVKLRLLQHLFQLFPKLLLLLFHRHAHLHMILPLHPLRTYILSATIVSLLIPCPIGGSTLSFQVIPTYFDSPNHTGDDQNFVNINDSFDVNVTSDTDPISCQIFYRQGRSRDFC